MSSGSIPDKRIFRGDLIVPRIYGHADDDFFKSLGRRFKYNDFKKPKDKPVGSLSVKWYRKSFTDRGGGYDPSFEWDMDDADLMAFAKYLYHSAAKHYYDGMDDR